VKSLRYFILLLAVAAAPSLSAQRSLCEPVEESIFWCETNAKRFELCASRNLDSVTGYMQYRAGSGGRPEFKFPGQLIHPKGAFELSLLAKGTMLHFRNGTFSYEIYQPLMGRAWIAVAGENQKESADIQCKRDSDTLNLTSTIDRFRSIGIFK
jgi:hypothetical protein